VSELAFLSPTSAVGVPLRTPMAGLHTAPLRERDGWLLPDYPAAGDAPVWVSDASQLGKIEVRGTSLELDVAVGAEEAGSTRRDGEAWIARLTPTRALVLCPGDEVGSRLGALRNGAVDLTCGWAAVRLGGPARLDLFARVSELDARPRTLPAGAVVCGPVAECAGIVVNEGDALLLLVSWEYGAYLWEAVLDLGEPLGVVAA
jgi:sarcosine oxidase gamma subunit